MVTRIYSNVFEHVLLPIVEWKYGMRVRKQLRGLEETQWWTVEHLRELQAQRLRPLIKHAYENVPYYRKIFKQRGLTPSDIQSASDLTKLPILTKKEIGENFDAMLSSDFAQRKPKLNFTSGSTATPLQYYIDWESWSMAWACIYFGWRLAGYKFGDKMATLSDFYATPKKKDAALQAKMRLLIERNLALPVLRLSDEIMERHSKLLLKHQPRFIRGYPSAIYVLADYLKRHDLSPIKPKAIFTTSEVLLPRRRKLIEKVFRCPVFDGYGCGDGGGSAIECFEHNGHHIPIQRCVMEFVDNEGQAVPAGQEGNIVLTDLFNYSMPFIRYQVGDIGVPSDRTCPCGRGMPLIGKLRGRTSDILKFRDGTVVTGVALTTILEYCSAIRQYQIVQLDMDNLLVRIVKGKEYTEQDSKNLLMNIKQQIGQDINVDIQFVEEIPATRTGKRFIISHMPDLL